jgi:hypothetical protein
MKKTTTTTIISVLLVPADRSYPMTMVNLRKGDYALTDMYKHMECDYVQTVPVPRKGIVLWVDEEGTLKRDPKINVRASILAGQQIMGNAILSGQDSLYGVNNLKMDDLIEFLNKVELSAHEMIKLHPSLNQ